MLPEAAEKLEVALRRQLEGALCLSCAEMHTGLNTYEVHKAVIELIRAREVLASPGTVCGACQKITFAVKLFPIKFPIK